MPAGDDRKVLKEVKEVLVSGMVRVVTVRYILRKLKWQGYFNFNYPKIRLIVGSKKWRITKSQVLRELLAATLSGALSYQAYTYLLKRL
ncbi:hypothetical protein CXK86_20140 [Paenibacillus sp. BGI2013]|uniref:hypothetical protein n=1 Tax=Paenibacillus sp. BGI2013 TaxID=2058902 RepID=UPI000C6ECDCD|nr:hypothetical protein [Paenibacillus sp. BGI2013]PKQ89363.1 hypothetical protein CXK86_20140 [Paenibacillus sp. BGI2013]